MIVVTRSQGKFHHAGASEIQVEGRVYEIEVFFRDHTGATTGELHLVISEARELWEELGRALEERASVESPALEQGSRSG